MAEQRTPDKGTKQERVRLPKQVRELLARQVGTQLHKETELIFSTETDMNLEGALTTGYVVLASKGLFVVTAEPNEAEPHLFKGMRSLQERAEQLSRSYEAVFYAREALPSLAVLRTVCGGILYVTEKKKKPEQADGKASGEADSRTSGQADGKASGEADSRSSGQADGKASGEADSRTSGQADGKASGEADTLPVEEKQLAAFTNACMGGIMRLVKLFEVYSDKGELTDEDFQGDDEEEYCPKCGSMYPDKERKICPKCMDRRSVFMRTLAYFRPFIGRIIVMMLCYAGTAVLNLVWPYLNGTILYDKVLAKNETFAALLGFPAGRFVAVLGLVVLTMLLTKIVMQGLGILQGVMTAKIVPKVVRNMKAEVFRSMGTLSISFYNSRQTGSLMTRVLSDAERVTGFFIDGLPYLLINLLTIVLSVIVMVRMNWRLALASLCFMPLLFFISFRMMPRLWSFYGKRHRAERSLNAHLNDNLTGARVVKAFGQQESEIERFGKYNARLRGSELSVASYDNRYYALYAACENLSSVLVWSLGAYLLLTQTNMELGMLITFTSYLSQLNGPLDFISYAFRWFTDSLNSAQRIFEIIDAVPEIVEKPDAVHLQQVRGDIELKNVTFGYEPHKPVLKNVSLKIEGGKMLGIVGRSGAGKSTLVNLISRLYDPQEGTIYLDGVNIKDLAFSDLRKNVAMVSQETYIFIGTVAENIAYANPQATKDDIVNAAVLASAHDFICKMPDGYDTLIGASGRTLSGGERQRISIARAILANPKILILDEATASVDTETEKAIQASINFLVKDRTTISIAHRLSTLRDADRLVVIDNGEVTEAGTHDELIAKKGTYYKLKELQSVYDLRNGMIGE